MIKISVIIPVFNVEPYLKRCLESVCNQTLGNIEIICVDDCSTDNSAKILQEYVTKYQNLKAVYFQQNQGVSSARNVGLNLAQGEYVAFVDSDDEIDLNFYEKLYAKAKQTNADVVKGQAIEIGYDGKKNVIKQIPQGSKWNFLSYWVLAIYKREIITKNNLSFSSDHLIGEDLLFLNKFLIVAQNLYLVSDVYYHYYRRENSSNSKILCEEKIKSALNVFEKITDNINANLDPESVDYSFIFYNSIMSCLDLALKTESMKARHLCANAVCNIFEKCRNQKGMSGSFKENAPLLFELLRNNDSRGVEDFLGKCKSRAQLIVSGLRARLKKENLVTISIIMPVKNGENYLAQALTAIKAQNVKMEIIVVNDGSNDNTVQIAQDFGCVILHHDESKGLVASKNTALKVARGKYIMFHDHDDLLNQNALTEMLKELEESPEIYAVMAQLQDFFSPELSEKDKAKVALRTQPYCGLFSGATLIKKEVFDVIGLFDENLRAGDMIEWKGKMEKNNLPIKKLNFVSANRRIHNSNYGRLNKAGEYKDYASILRAKILSA